MRLKLKYVLVKVTFVFTYNNYSWAEKSLGTLSPPNVSAPSTLGKDGRVPLSGVTGLVHGYPLLAG